MTRVSSRNTRWWLAMLRRRRARMADEKLELTDPVHFANAEQHRAAIKFFNAAFRAEQSGLRQAHDLADEVATWDPELGEVLRLYGDEEGWHQSLLEEFLAHLGGNVMPMGRVTSLLFRLYARAERMETIVLTNLMFETIGSTTYRLALRRARHPAVRQMLTILTRDESFHVPLNVHFLEHVLERSSRLDRWRLVVLHRLVFASLLALPLASRPKSRAFDGIGTLELSRAYGAHLAALFNHDPKPLLRPPWLLLKLLGVHRSDIERSGKEVVTSVEAAERSANRDDVRVTAL